MEEQLIYIIMLASLGVSGLCSVLEATLLSTPLSYITGLEEQGVKGALRLKKLKQNSDRPISAILCLNTIANTIGASIVGSLVYEVYGDAVVGIFSTVFTLLILRNYPQDHRLKLLEVIGHSCVDYNQRDDIHNIPARMDFGASHKAHIIKVKSGERKP